jgi:hypothetical protein
MAPPPVTSTSINMSTLSITSLAAAIYGPGTVILVNNTKAYSTINLD